MSWFDGFKQSPATVKARWRSLAAEHHPDRGGDTAVFNEIKHEYDLAMVSAMRPRSCETCHGSGKVEKCQGFSVVIFRCAVCHGKGYVHPGDIK